MAQDRPRPASRNPAVSVFGNCAAVHGSRCVVSLLQWNLMDEEFGIDRLEQACLAPKISAESLIGKARLFAFPKQLSDDATALILRRSQS